MDETRFAELLAQARLRWASSADLEPLFRWLRESGAGPLESVRVILAFTGMNLTEGKRALFFSATWADRRAEFDAAERMLEALLRLEARQRRTSAASGGDPTNIRGEGRDAAS